MHPEIHCGFAPKNDATVILSVIVNHCLISWARFSSYQGWVPSTVSTHSLLPLYVRPCFAKHRSNQQGPLLKIYQNKPNPKILPLQIMSGGISVVFHTSMVLKTNSWKLQNTSRCLCFFLGGGGGIQPRQVLGWLLGELFGFRMVQVKHTMPHEHQGPVRISTCTIWLFNIAMENLNFWLVNIGKPSISMGHFPWLC